MTLPQSKESEVMKEVRYAVVGLGDIAQGAFLPGVVHTKNSRVTALVTADPEKARELGKKYEVEATYDYGQFAELLASKTIDAIYLATPNWRHAEFAIPALQAGVHVLTEKPLEISVEKCQSIIDAQKKSSAKLMVAYRLHFEPTTLDLVSRIRSGSLGEVHAFTATFAQMVSPKNHRAKNGELAGPLFDMGPYPINASRFVFGAEPIEVVSAVGTRHPDSGFGDFSDTVAATLRFPGDRIAQFVVSYYGEACGSYHVLGTKGTALVNPGFTYGEPLVDVIAADGEKKKIDLPETDQFGGELKYFSDCILQNRDPEPDGEEGLADVRVIEGILEAIETGRSVVLPPFERSKRIDPDAQRQTLSAVDPPKKKVNAASPTKG